MNKTASQDALLRALERFAETVRFFVFVSQQSLGTERYVAAITGTTRSPDI
jgi:hypothetical protein